MKKRCPYFAIVTVGIAALIGACASQMGGEPSTGAAVRVDEDDIGGVVTGDNGPEAGVWVIAETTELPTRFTRSVVTVKGATSYPIFQKRIMTFGCAATV